MSQERRYEVVYFNLCCIPVRVHASLWTQDSSKQTAQVYQTSNIHRNSLTTISLQRQPSYACTALQIFAGTCKTVLCSPALNKLLWNILFSTSRELYQVRLMFLTEWASQSWAVNCNFYHWQLGRNQFTALWWRIVNEAQSSRTLYTMLELRWGAGRAWPPY